jgi:hypothetical protein
MAKAAKGGTVSTRKVTKKSSLGRHAKKDSPTKTSKNYKKPNRGQGR